MIDKNVFATDEFLHCLILSVLHLTVSLLLYCSGDGCAYTYTAILDSEITVLRHNITIDSDITLHVVLSVACVRVMRISYDKLCNRVMSNLIGSADIPAGVTKSYPVSPDPTYAVGSGNETTSNIRLTYSPVSLLELTDLQLHRGLSYIIFLNILLHHIISSTFISLIALP